MLACSCLLLPGLMRDNRTRNRRRLQSLVVNTIKKEGRKELVFSYLREDTSLLVEVEVEEAFGRKSMKRISWAKSK